MPALLTVNSLADTVVAGSSLTLREAILLVDGTLGRSLTIGEQAQISGSLGSNDTIQFSLPSGPQTISLTGGALNITRPVSIIGPGAGNLSINGNNFDRVFVVGQIWSLNLSQVVAISNLTVTGGNQVYGGGLLNFGTLTVSNCTFSGNSAGSSGGAGIYNVGQLTVQNSTFSGNTVSQVGTGGGLLNISSGNASLSGCVFTGNTATGTGASASSGAGAGNSGTMRLSNCTFTSNTAASNGGGVFNSGGLTVTTCSFANNSSGADGGGIDQDGTATVTYATFSGNIAVSEGGAMHNIGTLTISNSTMYGNSATSDGGGFSNYGSAQLVNCTVTANNVISGSGGISGGGIYAQVAPSLLNTIVAGNFQGASPSTTANDISGSMNAASAFNMIGTGGSGGLVNGTNGNQVGVGATGLGALANNGGPTQTVALLANSPALGRGSNAYVAAGATDQRGLARNVNGAVDIGALESQMISTSPSNQIGSQNVSSAFNLGSFTDANAAGGPWSVDVNWGDGSSHSVFATSAQGALGTLAHSFQTTGNVTVTVVVTDANHDSSQGTFQVTVATGPAVITVNSLADNITADTMLTLREAVLLVNGTLGRALTAGEQAQVTGTPGLSPTIQFGLPFGPQTITLTGGALAITGSVTINGPGASNLTINGNNTDRVLVIGQIYSKNLSQNVSMTGLTFSGGKQAYGAGILNFATLSLTNCIVSNNVGGTSGGGGIYNVGSLTLAGCGITGNSIGLLTSGAGLYNLSGAVATVTTCIFSNNVAGGTGSVASSGGGAYNSGTITFTSCTFNANTAGSDAGAFFNNGTATALYCAFTNNYCGADGGALHSVGTFTVNYCNVSGNTASSSGGGMEESTGVKLTISNTVFANNTAGSTAGGLVNWGQGVTLTNVTFTGNRAINSNGSTFGGGIWAGASFTLQNSIVAGNFKGTGATPNDFAGNVNGGGSYNLIGTGGAGNMTNGVNHNIVGVANPGLSLLASYGGQGQAIALLPGSPALNQGNNALVAAGSTDQRGFTRIANGTVDIGAFEAQMVSTSPGNQAASQYVAGTFNLGSFSDGNAGAGPWNVDVNWGDGTAHTIFSTSSQGALPAKTHALAQSGAVAVTVTVTDANNESSQGAFVVNVNPTVASSLAITGFPTLITTGIAGTFTVTAVDANGQKATNYLGRVHFTSTDPLAVLPADYTFVAADNGAHAFTATLKTLGIQSLTATDTVTSSIKGSQTGIQINSTAPAVITVNSLSDNTTADGALTLREAILLNNGTLGRALTSGEQLQITGTLGSSNTIQFGLPFGPQTITLTGGALNITQPVTIIGPGANNLAINGNNLDRVFVVGRIWSPNLSQIVVIWNLSVVDGNQSYGGGLLNFAALTVNNCIFTGNSAGSSGGAGIYNVGQLLVQNSIFNGNTVSQLGTGGGILNIGSAVANMSGCVFTGNVATGAGSTASSGAAAGNSGNMQLSNCTFTGNIAASNGGGIFNSGALTVSSCTFANNSCGADGGGIDQDGTATVTNTTFSGNFSASEGGAMDNIGSLTMSNCTLYGNTATSDGGGLATSGSAQLVNCTITANNAVAGSSGLFGGGIYTRQVAPSLFNTIVAGNFQGASPSTTPNDLAGSVNAASAFNLIGTGGSGGLVHGANGNQVGVSNPGLGALTNNGGPTQTVALQLGSLARGRGSNAYVAAGATDQRGFTRIIGGAVDIGAYEVQVTATPTANQTATRAVTTLFNLGSFTDASSAGPWSVTVNWGDATPSTAFSAVSQGVLIPASHTYQQSGAYTVIVTVTDANGDSSQVTFQIVVS